MGSRDFLENGQTAQSDASELHLRNSVRAATAAGLLLLIFVLRADLSHSAKSTTFDELAHLTAGVANWETGDYRLNPENGILQQQLIAWPVWRKVEPTFPDLSGADADAWRRGDAWGLGFRFFYELGNDPVLMLRFARRVTILWAAGLGILVFVWANRLFGPWSGVLAVFAMTFDPNLIAHARLATADVPAATGFLLALFALIRFLEQPGWLRASLLGFSVGILALVKFSALLFAPVVALVLIARFSFREHRRQMSPRNALLGLALAVGVAWLMIWAGYGFQSESHAQPPLPADADAVLDQATEPLGTTGQLLGRAADAGLLPEAYVLGLARTLSSAQARTAFLDGEVRQTGWRTFFFWAFAWKTPLGMLLLLAAALVLSPATWGRLDPSQRFGLASLLVLAGVYLAAAGSSRLNLGWRHLLPVMPVLYVAIGSLGRWLGRRACWWLAVPLGVLALESLAVHPHYLAFFNQAAGGPANGYQRLVDSSLDWGQDLPGLAEWLEKENASEPVYLSYFGTGDPKAQGISAIDLPFYPDHRPRPPYELKPGIYCISATQLQGVYLPRSLGTWTPDLQQQLDQAQAAIQRVHSIADPVERDRFVRARGVAAWQQLLVGAERLRFAKLLSWLREQEPDDQIGYSILIYRIDADELAELFGSAI